MRLRLQSGKVRHIDDFTTNSTRHLDIKTRQSFSLTCVSFIHIRVRLTNINHIDDFSFSENLLPSSKFSLVMSAVNHTAR